MSDKLSNYEVVDNDPKLYRIEAQFLADVKRKKRMIHVHQYTYMPTLQYYF